MKSTTHMMHICWFVIQVQDIFSARIWKIYEVFQGVVKVDGPMTLSVFLRRMDMQLLCEGLQTEG